MMMAPETFERFHRILRGLRTRGEKVDFPSMACAVDVARFLEEGDRTQAVNRARALGITEEELDRWTE